MAKIEEDRRIQIRSMFKEHSVYDFTVEVNPLSNGRSEVKVYAMYESPELKDDMSLLIAMQKIAETLGFKDMDVPHKHSQLGCETCDYWSEYGWTFIAWNPAETSESTALNPEIAEPKAPQSASTKGESL